MDYVLDFERLQWRHSQTGVVINDEDMPWELKP